MRRHDLASLTRIALVSLALAGLSLASGCSSGSDNDAEILVFAASSLTDAFNVLADDFETSHGGAVTLNFASSSTLSTQITEGAPAAVFASANEAQMQKVVDSGRAIAPSTFATNRLVVIVPATGSPVTTFEDLAKPRVKLVIAGSEVPVGAYARQFIASYNQSASGYESAVMANVVSEEPNVRAVLTKVQLGEADAGIVYETDAAIAGGDVETLPIPVEFNVVATYPIVAISDGQDAQMASDFVDFVLSDAGQAVLRSYGFGPKPGS